MPIANIILIVFLLAMVYWWSTQGFFSAFLHLGLVIVAGTLAFAFWEPVAFLMLGSGAMATHYAWGVSLLGVFFVSLIVLRLLGDKLVPMNVQFVNLASTLGGAACGLASGLLTAGVTFIGLGFLPLPVDFGGVQPYALSGQGQVVEGESDLWVGVDRMAGSFFSALSGGSFAPFLSDTALASHRPGVAQQAALFRLRYDANASIVATPDSVAVGDVVSMGVDRPESLQALDSDSVTALGEAIRNTGNKLVLIDTLWQVKSGTYDSDSTLRLPPTQVRLVATRTRGGVQQTHLHAPVAFVKEINPETKERHLYPIDDDRTYASAAAQAQTIAWAFLIPAEQAPRYLFVRGLRIELPENLGGTPEKVAAMLGTPAPEPEPEEGTQTAGAGEPGVGARQGAVAGHVATDVELTNKLPTPFSKNAAPTLNAPENSILSGQATVEQRAGGLSQRTRVDSIHQPSHLAMVRLRIAQDRAQSLLGAARASAASLQGVWLTDNRGQKWQPIAYVWHKGGASQEISVDLNNPIRSARQLPVPQMRDGDDLYLYFLVSRGITIESYNIGTNTQQTVNLQVP